MLARRVENLRSALRFGRAPGSSSQGRVSPRHCQPFGALDTLERTALTLALARCNHSPTAAARLLGTIGRGRSSDPGGTVRAMMRRHGLKG
jgi:hypothetical protein